jgi:hypothetical protein
VTQNILGFCLFVARSLRGLLCRFDFSSARAQSATQFHNRPMTEKEIVLETIRALPDDCSLEEIAERIEFMAAVQKGLDQLDRGEGIPHDEVKRQLASWLTN